MEIRFTVSSKKAENILLQVSRNERKLFIQEALIYYEKALRTEPDLYSVHLNVEKDKIDRLNSRLIDLDNWK